MRLRRFHAAPRGIALVITLVMLSVVTLMAVTFLAVSRRERAAVTVFSDQVDARAMAEMALSRAQAELAARMHAATNLLNYDLLVSTNFIGGFNRADGTNLFNVGYTYRGSDRPLDNEDDLLQNLRNLQFDPRPPVFIRRPGGPVEFRYFLDFNRNQRFDTNGLFVGLDLFGRPLDGTNRWVGDPEWIGVLRRPDLPHSGTNPFIGRFAYLVLPAGKSLDVNFAHNMARRSRSANNTEGFHRNTGAGSWELNLAAFLRGLNTNAWGANTYFYTPQAANNRGRAFGHAFGILQHRYAGSFFTLTNFVALYGPAAGNVIQGDGNDIYAVGNLMQSLSRTNDVEDPRQRWSGDDSRVAFDDVQELLTRVTAAQMDAPESFSDTLRNVQRANSTYNQHTFYRLLGQLGTHSLPANRGKLHLNYDNRLDLRDDGLTLEPGPAVGFHSTNFVYWTPLAFFTNAADLMVRASFHGLEPRSPLYGATNLPSAITNLTATSIPVWPDNYYSPAVHRLFQLAANLYDARSGAPQLAGSTRTNPLYLPTVFRPVFGQLRYTNALGTPVNGLGITGWAVVTNDWLANVWNAPRVDPQQLGTTAADARLNQGLGQGNLRVAGIPVVIGARRGYPNFNEFSLQVVATAGRKLEMVKNSPNGFPVRTNQMYSLGIESLYGVEFWNSYRTAYPRALQLRTEVQTEAALSNRFGLLRLPAFGTNYQVTVDLQTNALAHNLNGTLPDIPASQWQGRAFRLPIATNLTLLRDSYFSVRNQQFLALPTSQTTFEHVPDFEAPSWDLWITNRLRAIVVDTAANQIVDYVDLDDLNTRVNISRALFGRANDSGQLAAAGLVWSTNRVQSTGLPEGIQEQINVALGASPTRGMWNDVTGQPADQGDRALRIARFRQFVRPDIWPAVANTPPTLRMQVPFSPARRLYVNRSWQVNDPLVRFLPADLADPLRDPSGGPDGIDGVEPILEIGPLPTDQNNLGLVNERYQPWAMSSSANPLDFEWAVKDPQITASDAWEFPTNAFPNLGWIGRVHRGTPWQTVYLKSGRKAGTQQTLDQREWFRWSGHRPLAFPNTTFIPPTTHPTNDWRLLQLFTAAPNENAARGLLGVNQEGLAAWNAVLGGVIIVTNAPGQTNVRPHTITPGDPRLETIVAGINAARTNRLGGRFNFLGEVLSTPELTDESPYLQLGIGVRGSPPDAALERIPQQILGLLKEDEPRVVIYGFGQSLRPAPDSAVVQPGPFFLMSTNYQITGEHATRAVVRFEGDPRAPRAVMESFNVLTPPE